MSNRNNQNNNNYYGNGNPYNGQNGQYYNGNGGRGNRQYNQNGQYYNGNNTGSRAHYSGQYYNNQYNQNAQYGKQNNMQNRQQPMNQYQANQNQSNKKEKKPLNTDLIKKIAMGVGAVFAIVILVLLFKSCTSSKEEVLFEDGQKEVGDSTYGYITVPSDWMKLTDVESSTGVRYSDKDITYAATIDLSNSLSPEEFANTAKKQLQNVGVTNLIVAEEKWNGYDAYKLTGFSDENGSYVLAYFFKAEDGLAHYVGVEGPDKDTNYFKIPQTYKYKK